MDRAPLFHDRSDAGRRLADAVAAERAADLVVVGLARGGVEVAAEVAAALDAPLDALAVRKVGHPLQPEYAIGAVTPGDGVFLRDAEDLTEDEVAAALDAAKTKAAVLDRRLHEKRPAAGLEGKSCLLVDDGLATGATMIAAVRFAKSQGARRVVAAVPVAADESLDLIRREADAVVCPNPVDAFWAVSLWYEEFWPVEDEDVLRLLREADARLTARPRP